jgi:hypothetical protein
VDPARLTPSVSDTLRARAARLTLATLGIVVATTGCRASGPTNACDRPGIDVADSIAVLSPERGAIDSLLATLHWEQRFAQGLDGGCTTTAALRLWLHGRTATPVSLRYHIAWATAQGGRFRDGAVARLAGGADVELGVVDGVEPLDGVRLSIAVSDLQAAPAR